MTGVNLFVGNLPYHTTSEELGRLFSQFGEVARAEVVADRFTGRSRGFGFVEMISGAATAIEAVHDAEFEGRVLAVNEARVRVGASERR